MSAPIPAATPFSESSLYRVPRAAMLVGACLGLLLPLVGAEQLGTILLGASLLFCGLPHGAGDVWALQLATRPQAWTRRRLGTLMAVYVGASLLTLALWWCQPVVALAGFLLLTAWHFGSADALLLTGGVARGYAWWLQAAGRGALVICAPLAFYQEESARLLAPFALQDAGTQRRLIYFLLVWSPALTAAALGMLAVVALPRVLAGQAGQVTTARRRAVASLGETCLVAALFWSAPPLLAFACYWIGAHAWRHVLRIEALQWWDAGTGEGGKPPSVWRMVLDYHERTLGMTLFSVAGLAIIFLIWPTLATGANGWTTAYFILLSALTVPHALVIGYLDWRTRRPLGSLPSRAYPAPSLVS